MEEWQKNLFEMVEIVACEIENFFMGLTEVLDEIVEQVESTDIEQFWEEILAQIPNIYEDFADEDFADIEQTINNQDPDFSYTYTEEATIEKNPACIGCHHYHGQVYGGNLLVCAMHPYGWDDQSCPDWESPQ